MENNGFLVECPHCAGQGVKQILGRVMPTGELLVLRFHHGTTLLKALSYELKCGCGFSWNISGTVVTSAGLCP